MRVVMVSQKKTLKKATLRCNAMNVNWANARLRKKKKRTKNANEEEKKQFGAVKKKRCGWKNK